PKSITSEKFLRATSVWEELGRIIQSVTEDPSSSSISTPLEDLLILHDELGEIMRSLEEKGLIQQKPTLRLKVLETLIDSHRASPNGSIMSSSSESGFGDEPEVPVDEETPPTPKIDKGKGRASPEPEIHEPVLSPTASFLPSPAESSEDEFEDALDTEDHLS